MPPGMSLRRENTGFLYSSRLLPATLAVGTYDFFATPIGTIGSGYAGALTATETNLAAASRIPDQQAFSIRDIGFYVANGGESGTTSTTPLADLMGILHYTNLSFVKPEYTYTFGPTFLFPGGAGIAGAMGNSSTSITTYQSWTNGVPAPTARIRMEPPINLNPGETFNFRLTVTTAVTLTSPLKAWVICKGISQARVAT